MQIQMTVSGDGTLPPNWPDKRVGFNGDSFTYDVEEFTDVLALDGCFPR